jgi:hypothetical protein
MKVTTWNTTSRYLLVSFIVLLLGAFVYFPNFHAPIMQDRWFICYEYIAAGTLYEQQPFCEQMPGLFYLGYTLITLFGTQMYRVLFLLTIGLNLWTLYLLRQMIWQETKRYLFFSLIISYFILVYFLHTIHGLPELLVFLFFFLGLYVLLYKEYRYKHVYVSVLFWCGLMTKFTVSIPITLTFVWYLFARRDHLKEMVSVVFQWIAPMAILTGVLVLVHKYVLYYGIIAHGTYPLWNYQQVLLGFIEPFLSFSFPDVATGVGYVIMLFALSLFFLRPHILSFVTCFGLLISLLKKMQISGTGVEYYYYFVPYYGLFLVCFWMWYYYKETFTKKVLMAGMLLVLLVPLGLVHVDTMQGKLIEKIELGVGVDVLSSLDGSLLLEHIPHDVVVSRYLPYLDVSLLKTSFIHPLFYSWDMSFGPRFVVLVDVDTSKAWEDEALQEEYKDLFSDITIEDYFDGQSLALYYAFYYGRSLFPLDIDALAEGWDNGEYAAFMYRDDIGSVTLKTIHGRVDSCNVVVPDSSAGERKRVFVFYDENECAVFGAEVLRYYEEKRATICFIDASRWVGMSSVLMENGFDIDGC